MTSILAIVSVTMLYCAGSTLAGAGCTQQAIAGCTGTNFNDPNSISTVCNNLNTINTCVVNLGCMTTDLAYIQYFQGQSNAAYYMCNDGKTLLMGIATCINTPNVQNSFPSCQSQQNNTVQANQNSDPTHAQCKGVMQYVQCMDSVISGSCGGNNNGQADAYGRFIQRQLAPWYYYQYNQCNVSAIADSYPQGPGLTGGTGAPTQAGGLTNPPGGITNPPGGVTNPTTSSQIYVTYYSAATRGRSCSSVLVVVALLTAFLLRVVGHDN